MIVRTWRGWVSTERVGEYVDYVTHTGLTEYSRVPGNLGSEIWTRNVGDGRSEVTTLSWWTSIDDVRGFAGDDIEQAVFYPEDDEYLIDRETTVAHHEVEQRRE
jgi:hypothetical protein